MCPGPGPCPQRRAEAVWSGGECWSFGVISALGFSLDPFTPLRINLLTEVRSLQCLGLCLGSAWAWAQRPASGVAQSTAG